MPDSRNLEKWLQGSFSYQPIEDLPRTDLCDLTRPSIRDKDIAEIRPKLKNDAMFLPSRDGVVCRSDRQSFFLAGEHIYPLLCDLEPLLTGELTLESICSLVSPGYREKLVGIIRLLVEGGILKDQPSRDSHELEETIQRRFSSQIALIDHLADQPIQRFRDFRHERLLLLGSGIPFSKCAASLLRYGLKNLFALPTRTVEGDLKEAETTAENLGKEGIDSFLDRLDLKSDSPDLGHFRVVAYCSDQPAVEDLLLLNRACCQEGCTFLPGYVIGNVSVLGPMVRPTASGCWLCGVFRVLENVGAEYRPLALGTRWSAGAGSSAAASISQMLGTETAFELFKLLAGGLRSQIEGHILIQAQESEDAFGVIRLPYTLDACMGYCQQPSHWLESRPLSIVGMV